MSGLWISDAADRIDDGDAMVLNHAVLQAAIHGHQLGAALVVLLKSDHAIHRDVRDALVALIDASGDKTKPVAIKIECRDGTAEGPITRRGREMFDTRMEWVAVVRAKDPAETWTAWRERMKLSGDGEKERRGYAEPILKKIAAGAPPMASAMGLPLAVVERMLQERLIWESVGSERALSRAKNAGRKNQGAGSGGQK